MRILVAAALADRQAVMALELPEGATIADALRACAFDTRFPELAGAQPAIWGREAGPGETLRDGDRVELLRPVSADAKAMRRARAALTPSRRPRSGS